MLKSILVSLIFFAVSCSNDQPKTETQETPPHATETNQAKLQLNNGKKWQLDDATRQNIKQIKTYVTQTPHANGEPSGEKLQQYADQLIKDCRMSGPDHDALHVWLGTFLQHVQALKDNRGTESASHAVTNDVNEFDTYFE